MNTNKNIPVVIASAVFIVFAVAASIPNKTTQNHFKNLKVLPKDISEEALGRVMDSFNYSLGVRCNFCHARVDTTTRHLDFASDAKSEKEIARNMMRMTYDINNKYFNFNKDIVAPQVIGCITCHRQNAMPPVDTIPVRKRG